MTNLTPGAKVIYFKSYSFDPAPARVGGYAPQELLAIGMW